MKVVFHSNFMNHHQRPFVEYLAKRGCSVTFVAHNTIPDEQKALGYRTNLNYVEHIEYNEKTADDVYKLTMEADAVIFGSKPKCLFRDRVRTGKLTFNYSERLFKRGIWQKYSLLHQIKLRKTYLFDRKNAPYVLAAGAYAAQDYKSLGYPKEKFLKWGYFPPLVQIPLPELMKNKQENTIVWVARFIPLKHPEYIVELGDYLRKYNIPFHIRMIGIGELLESTKKMIDSYGLSKCIEVVGAMPPEQVRREFDRAQIALLTSDRNEGWGAVVNEAMNSGCVMVASREAGSTTYLIQSDVNGMTYNKDKQQMFRIVKDLLQDKDKCIRLGSEAYSTITEIWNYQIAADRMMEFVRDQSVNYDFGPMSQG